jgi:hypothetical protein
VSIVLLEKQLDYHLAKLKELVVYYNLFIQTFVAQWMWGKDMEEIISPYLYIILHDLVMFIWPQILN